MERNLTWHPHHGLDGELDRADGYLQADGSCRATQLDITSLADTCCVLGDEGLRAKQAWDAGQVLVGDKKNHGATTLVVPFDTLTIELINEALRRFNP